MKAGQTNYRQMMREEAVKLSDTVCLGVGLHSGTAEADAFWIAIDTLISKSEIFIDRPKGTKHPRFDFIYPLDYGYLKDTSAMDGGGIDVWRGSLSKPICDAVACTVDLLKKDSEIKLLIGCTEEEKALIMRFHNDSTHMKGIMIRKGAV